MKTRLILVSLCLLLLIPCAFATLTDFKHGYRLSDGTDVNGTLNLTGQSVSIITGKIGLASNATNATSGYTSTTSSFLTYNELGSGNWAFSTWVYLDNTSTADAPILTMDSSNGGNDRFLTLLSSSTNIAGCGLHWAYYDVWNGADRYCSNGTSDVGAWQHIVVTVSGGVMSMYKNNTLILTHSVTPGSSASAASRSSLICNIDVGGCALTSTAVAMDATYFWNHSLNSSEIATLFNTGAGVEDPFNTTAVPNISNVVCTSCNAPFGSNTSPYMTDDTTPTFNFTTDNVAVCRISSANTTYSGMNSSRDCNFGQGTTTHICTLPFSDELTSYSTWVYVACANVNNASLTTQISLAMQIISLDTNATRYILNGVFDSSISGNVRTYTNQQVYLRAANGTAVLATVNVVAAYGNQRWIFDYANDTTTPPALFNLSPAVYSVVFTNTTTLTNIRLQTATIINSTKN